MDSESKAEEFEEQAIQDIKQGKLKVLNSNVPSHRTRKSCLTSSLRFYNMQREFRRGSRVWKQRANTEHCSDISNKIIRSRLNPKLSGSSTLIRPSQQS